MAIKPQSMRASSIANIRYRKVLNMFLNLSFCEFESLAGKRQIIYCYMPLRQVYSGAGSVFEPPKRSNKFGSFLIGVEIRLLLAGVKPNSEAIRIMISA